MKLFLDEFSVKELTDFANAAYGPEKFDTLSGSPGAGPGRQYLLSGAVARPHLRLRRTWPFRCCPTCSPPPCASRRRKKTVCILVATSGDTYRKGRPGGLPGCGPHQDPGVLSQDGVSAIQELQMVTQEGANVGSALWWVTSTPRPDRREAALSDEELRERLAIGGASPLPVLGQLHQLGPGVPPDRLTTYPPTAICCGTAGWSWATW